MDNFVLSEYLRALADKLDNIRRHLCYDQSLLVIPPIDQRVVDLTHVGERLTRLANKFAKED